MREEEFNEQVHKYEKKQLFKDIEHKKQDLAAREQVIYFFDNQEKLELLLPEKKE